MNEDDHKRMVRLWADAVSAAERLKNGGRVRVEFVVDRRGHVCRRRCSIDVKRYPLDEREKTQAP